MEITSQSLPRRLVSLDAFRGAVIALMVLVNTPGDESHTYGPLRHADWDGWTITDVVFPSFVWIVGMAITLSLGKRVAAGVRKLELMRGVARRAETIFILGLLVYLFPDFDSRTYGHGKLSDLVEKSGSFEIDRQPGRGMRIRLKPRTGIKAGKS